MNIPLTTRDLDRHEAERIPVVRHYHMEARPPVDLYWHQAPVQVRPLVRIRFVVALVVVAVWAVLG